MVTARLVDKGCGLKMSAEGLNESTRVQALLQCAAGMRTEGIRTALSFGTRMLRDTETLAETSIVPFGSVVDVWVGEWGGMPAGLGGLQALNDLSLEVLDLEAQLRERSAEIDLGEWDAGSASAQAQEHVAGALGCNPNIRSVLIKGVGLALNHGWATTKIELDGMALQALQELPTTVFLVLRTCTGLSALHIVPYALHTPAHLTPRSIERFVAEAMQMQIAACTYPFAHHATHPSTLSLHHPLPLSHIQGHYYLFQAQLKY